jgi:hypothetical protein
MDGIGVGSGRSLVLYVSQAKLDKVCAPIFKIIPSVSIPSNPQFLANISLIPRSFSFLFLFLHLKTCAVLLLYTTVGRKLFFRSSIRRAYPNYNLVLFCSPINIKKSQTF